MSNAAPAVLQSELVLGRYRPLRPLGSGGSGSVWLARDERNGLDVALKIVPREGKAGHRAEREAVVASRLRHERCLRAYACGSDTRHVYVAYEYAPGRTLRDALRAGELRDRDAVEAGAQVLEGLAHAHARGVVHRDVKPANVLLADGEGISVRLLDFGLAQTEDAETLTAAGDVPGTLAYIPPERLAGEVSGAAGDVWAVGVVLWEALAGVHPFWTSSPLETARAIERGAPPLPEARPDLPRNLTAAVGPLLAPIGALGFVPLLAARTVRSPARRFAHGMAAVLVAAVAAGIRGAELPFAGAHAHVALAGHDSALGVAGTLAAVVTAHAGIGLAALVLGAAAAALPKLRRLGPRGIPGAGALLLLPAAGAPAADPTPI